MQVHNKVQYNRGLHSLIQWTNRREGVRSMTIKQMLYTLIKRPHIVEQGTSGNWTYRKWSNGIAECCGRQSGNIPSGWSPDNTMIVTPPINFTEITSWQVNATNYQVTHAYITLVNANTAQVNTKSDSAIYAQFTICLYGKWK